MDFATGGIQGGFYGGGLAQASGAKFDPITFFMKPTVIIRSLCWIFSLIVFGAIKINGYNNETCIVNNNGSVCSFAVWLGFVGLTASTGFIVGEYFFDQMSSAKTRKHYVLADLGFSGFWAFMYFCGFVYIWRQWAHSPEPPFGSGNVGFAIFFSFLSVFTWGICTFYAFLRFNAGVQEIPFQSTYENDIPNQQAYNYSNENEQYQEPPFSQHQGMQQQQQYAQPNY